MKIIKLLSLITILLFSIQANSQTTNKKDLICSGKWHLEYMEMMGEKMNLSDSEQKNNWVIFHKDGRLEAFEMGDHYFGTWEFIEEKDIIRTKDRDGIKEQKIIKLDSKVFVYSIIFNEINTITGMKKMKE